MHKAYVLCVTAVLAFSAMTQADDRPVLLGDDERLHAEVTLKLACEPLSDFAKEISKATGVRIFTRGAVADRNVTIFAESVPAWEAMKNVALLFGYGWEMRGKEPNHGYVLFCPKKVELKAEELRNERWTEEDIKFRDRIEDGIKLIQADAKTRQAMFDKNPGQVVLDLFRKSNFEKLACLTKPERDALWAQIAADPKAEVRIPFQQLPDRLQEFYRGLAEEYASREEASEEFRDRWRDYQNREFVLSRAAGLVGSRLKNMPLSPYLVACGLSKLDAVGGGGREAPGWFHPMPEWELEEVIEAGIDTSSYMPPDTVHYSAPDSRTDRIPLKAEDEEEEDEDGQPLHLSDVLEAMSRIFKLNTFADDYLFREANLRSGRATLPENIEEALAELEREFEYEATLRGKTLLFRNSTWYMDEIYEIPKRLVTRWLALKEEQGRLQFRDHIDIAASVTDFQATRFYTFAFHLSIARPIISNLRRILPNLERLRFCAVLTPNQLRTAMNDQLPATSMNAVQLGMFVEQLRDVRPELADDLINKCGFRVRLLKTEKESQYDPSLEKCLVIREYAVFTYIFGPDHEQNFEFDIDYTSVSIETLSTDEKAADDK